MKKIATLSFLACLGLFIFAYTSTAEARCHHRHHRSTSFQVGFNAVEQNNYVVQRYITPAPTPVYVVPGYYAPTYVAYPAPVYVEQVYVTRQRPSLFTGLSLSWNFFK